VVERLFGTLNTQVLHHLLGNTQATARPRQLTAASDPRRQSVWTLAALTERVHAWADQEYDTLRHPALGQSPREAYAQSLARDGERQHKQIAYDDAFIMATLPSTRRGVAVVQPGRGVRMHYLDYWCEEMRDPLVERTRVPVRFDPFDVSVGYAFIAGCWRRCHCACEALAGCTQRELQVLAEELRKRNRLQRGQEHLEVTQRQLAAFRRETVTQENVLRQKRRDREAAAAFTVLEGGRDHAARAPAGVREATPLTDPQEMVDGPHLVLHRYQP
jgi:putative transposase